MSQLIRFSWVILILVVMAGCTNQSGPDDYESINALAAEQHQFVQQQIENAEGRR